MTNYKKFFALIKSANAQGHSVDRHDLVYEFTSGRTDSLREATPHEIMEMEAQLEKLTNTDSQKADKMRKKIISVFHNLNYKLPNGKVNMHMVEAWVRKYGYLHKPFNSYSSKELPKLVTQAEKFEKSVLK